MDHGSVVQLEYLEQLEYGSDKSDCMFDLDSDEAEDLLDQEMDDAMNLELDLVEKPHLSDQIGFHNHFDKFDLMTSQHNNVSAVMDDSVSEYMSSEVDQYIFK